MRSKCTRSASRPRVPLSTGCHRILAVCCPQPALVGKQRLGLAAATRSKPVPPVTPSLTPAPCTAAREHCSHGQQEEDERRRDGDDARKPRDGRHLATQRPRAHLPALLAIWAYALVVRRRQQRDRVRVWDARPRLGHLSAMCYLLQLVVLALTRGHQPHCGSLRHLWHSALRQHR